jgi:hypothetical protein
MRVSKVVVVGAILCGGCGSGSRPEATFGEGVVTGDTVTSTPIGSTTGTGILHVDASAYEDPTNSAPAGCASLSGTVTTPAMSDPLYNAVVYVANGSVDPVASGVSCDQCGGLSAAKALTAALTGPDGTFTLTGVPLGDVALVIQLGKWRRVVNVHVGGCGEVTVPGDLTRLPRNRGEGNIPLTALATGDADSLECVLRKVGVDDAEFTVPSGGGRIHLYHATGANAAAGATPDQTALWSDLSNLEKYDVILLPCENSPNTDGKEPGYANLVRYADEGGRAFVTHYNYTWIRSPTARFPATANWTEETKYFGTGYDYPVVADVNLSFQKGRDFAQWLENVGASTGYGTVELNHVVHVADSALPDVAEPWLTSVAEPRQYQPDGSTATQRFLHHYTFNTPVNAPAANQCGRVVYSAFHVNDAASSGTTFPAECSNGPLSAQEKVLMFMLFDLASCVQTDKESPAIPVIR